MKVKVKVKVIQNYILTLNFIKESIIDKIDLQSQIISVDQKTLKESLHILEDVASSMQVDILNIVII